MLGKKSSEEEYHRVRDVYFTFGMMIDLSHMRFEQDKFNFTIIFHQLEFEKIVSLKPDSTEVVTGEGELVGAAFNILCKDFKDWIGTESWVWDVKRRGYWDQCLGYDPQNPRLIYGEG